MRMDGLENLVKINELFYKTGIQLITNENDFVRFLEQGAATDGEYENGAVIVITGKQYILAVNEAGGTGSHDPTYAVLMHCLNGNAGRRLGFYEKVKLTIGCRRNFLIARIIYEKGETICAGGIDFDLRGDKKITVNQYRQFVRFYQDFNDIIREMTRHFPHFSVRWLYNENGRTIHSAETNDLTALHGFLLTRVDYSLNDNDENEVYLTGEIAGLTSDGNVPRVRK